MVTPEERDELWAAYAPEPRMRLNLGIRRRLAPLLGNNRRKIELFHGLLLALPGSPILYYGDEIGMGDNIRLEDRDGVRTPMQWTPDRNGGFSGADYANLYLPALLDPVYGYPALNVEAQQRQESSLLSWLRRLIALRKRHPVFGLGGFETLDPPNHALFAFVRTLDETTVLCIYNLSRAPQPAELDLSRYAGRTPVELTGGARFPRIGSSPYALTLDAHGFFWFELSAFG